MILYGKVQAGKTDLILAMIWIGQFVHGLPCVLALANMVSSYNQVLGKNACEFNQSLLDQFGERARPYLLKTTGFRGTNTDGDHTDHTWLRVAMSNPAQIRRVLASALVRDHQPFLLFSDEADCHVKSCDEDSDTTSTGPLMRELQDRAVGSVKISATLFAMWNQKDATQKTIKMRTGPNYRGIFETEWVFHKETDASAVRKGDHKKAVRMLEDMIAVVRPRVENDRRKYLSILINAPSQIRAQNVLAQKIAGRRRDWNVYVMNSDGGKTSISQATPNRIIRKEIETVSSLYDIFENESPDRFNINVIVAGMTAARAISFRPTSRLIGTGGLHGMLFFPSVGCNAAQLIQFMRPWGNYDDDYPRVCVLPRLGMSMSNCIRRSPTTSKRLPMRL